MVQDVQPTAAILSFLGSRFEQTSYFIASGDIQPYAL